MRFIWNGGESQSALVFLRNGEDKEKRGMIWLLFPFNIYIYMYKNKLSVSVFLGRSFEEMEIKVDEIAESAR